jgi:hypothetical protein
MIGFTTMSRSMNGIKTLSDGISIISDGVAQHENIIYSEFIYSEDGKTQMINNQLTTEIVECQNLNADDIMSLEINTDLLKTKNIKVIDNSGNEIFIGDGINKKFTFNGNTEFNELLTIINKNLNQTQGGYIYQTGTNFNTLKDTKINGFLEVGSNFTQTGGSTTLKDLTVDNVNMNTNKGITQNGSGTSNTFGNSTITDLIITGSITFPSSVVIPGTTTSDDIIMEGDSVITQDITTSTTKFNKFRYTKTLDLDVGGDLTMTEAGTTATLKNTIIQGTSTLQGDIEQTAGFTKLNTIECNNITLRTNNDLNISGTGKINQIGTGINALNAIVLNSNQNITFNGNGIISQPLNGINILSHFRGAGFGIIGGRNNTTFSHYQNIQNNNGLQFQFNRDNASFYSYLLNNRTGSGGGFRFQRYNGGVYVDEPLVIDDNITFNKDVSIVGKSISASSATLGIITQNEIDCLDNCNINIITKFNNLDSQISSLETTTGGVSSATTGITYNTGSDTTTIDNNLIVSSGKTFNLGSINVNNFITDTNTFITAATNTLQGIVYTGINDTTTFNNNVSITGDLVVQGMNIKAEIDALETSFTTGTLTTTTLTAGTLNITNQINMINPTRAFRNINNIGYLNFCDTSAGSDINSFSMGQSGVYTYLNNLKNNGIFQFTSLDTDNKLFLMPNVFGAGSYNSTTKADDILLLGIGGSIGTQSLNLSVWSDTPTGLRVEPTKTIMTGGNNKITVDNTDGVIIDGIQKINDSLRLYNGVNYTELKQSGNDLLITNSTNAQPIVNIDGSLINLKIDTTIDTNLNVNNNTVITNTINNNQSLFTRQNIFSDVFLTTKTGQTLNNSNNASGSGTSTQTVFTFSISPNFNKQISLSIPISVFRSFKNISTVGLTGNNFTDTISKISYTIYKNNEAWQGGNCIPNNSLPREFVLSCSAKTSDMSYEYYFTNASINFFPVVSNITNFYKVDFTVHYSYTINPVSNFTGLNYAYLFNTNISTVSLNNISVVIDPITGLPVISANNPNYSNGSYTLTKDTINYFTGGGELWTNDIISNGIRNQGTIQTNNLYCSGNIRMNNGLAGYHIDGTSNFLPTPIFCSMKSFLRSNTDNSWFLNAGFKVELFNSPNYVSFITTLDNTNSLVGNVFELLDSERDRTDSFKVYFLGVEITYPLLS